MKRFLIIFFLSFAVSVPAPAPEINGELKNALLEGKSSDPTGNGAVEQRIYYNTSEKKTKVHDGNGWVPLGAGGGTGVNYIGDPNSDTNWTGSGSGMTSSTTTDDDEIPRVDVHDQAHKITLSSGTGDYRAYCFQMGEAEKNGHRMLRFAQLTSGLSDDDARVELYTNDGADCGGSYSTDPLNLDGDNGSSNQLLIKARAGVVETGFDADDSDWYELRFVNNGGTSGWLSLNDVTVGPGEVWQSTKVTYDKLTDQADGTSDFTGSETILISKEGNGVTLSWPTLSHSKDTSGGDATTDSGFIPEKYRPTVGRASALTDLGSVVVQSQVETDGTLHFDVRQWDGSRSNTSAIGAGSMSWTIEDDSTVNTQASDPTYVSHDGSNIVYGQDGAEIPTSTPGSTSDSYNITTAYSNVQSSDDFILQIRNGDGAGNAIGPWLHVGNAITERLRYDGTNYIGAAVTTYTNGDIYMRRGKYRVGTSTAWSTISSGTRWRVRRIRGQNAYYDNATSEKAGLVEYSYEELDITDASGDFDDPQSTSDGIIRISRVNEQVTMTWPQLDHSAASDPTSGTLIPAEYRPDDRASTLFMHTDSVAAQAVVFSDGSFKFQYRDWTGSKDSTKTVSDRGTISWTIDKTR